jgi:membrane-associated protease RseP (regulator of RpoE activity)
MTLPRAVRGWCGLLWLAACTDPSAQKLADFAGKRGVDDLALAALQRLRFAPLRLQDPVHAGDLVLCGQGDRVVLAISKKWVSDYLGIDAPVLLPELFAQQSASEVFTEIVGPELFRLQIPPGIGATVSHPEARVRELGGSPRFSSDVRAVTELFALRQVFAAQAPAASAASEPAKPAWQLGITALPRMGPKNGVVIERVAPGSAAALAGLRPGDKIVGVDGEAVLDVAELRAALASHRGANVVLRVIRAGSVTSELLTVPRGP